MVSVPPPLRDTFAAFTTNSVTLFDEPSVIVPALLMALPKTLRAMPFAIVRLSPEWLSVRLPTEAVRLSFTDAVVVPMVTSTVLLLGTPLFQLAALFQLVPSPLPVQLSLVFGGGIGRIPAECAGARSIPRLRRSDWPVTCLRLETLTL